MRILLYLCFCALAASALPVSIKKLQNAIGVFSLDYLFTLDQPYDFKATVNYTIQQDDSLAFPAYVNYTLTTYQDGKPQVRNGSIYGGGILSDFNDYDTDDDECWASGTGMFTASGSGQEEGGNYYGYLATSCEHDETDDLPSYNMTSEFSGVYRDGYTQGKGQQTRDASYPGAKDGYSNRTYESSISWQFEGFLNHTGLFKNVSGNSIFMGYHNASSFSGAAYSWTGNGFYDPASWTLTTNVTVSQITSGEADYNQTYPGFQTTGLYPELNSDYSYSISTFNKFIRNIRTELPV